MVAPRQRDVREVAVVHRRAGAHARRLDPQAQVGVQPQLEVEALERRGALLVRLARVLPVRRRAPVVVDRVALHVHLHRPVDAAQRAQQDVLGVVVGRRAAVRVRALAVVAPRPDEQHVADDEPAGLRAPRRLEDVRPRQVAPPRRHDRVGGREREHARVAVEHRAEDARAVHPRQAHPLDVAAGRDERRRLAVRQEPVLGDRRERAAGQRDVGEDRPHASMRRAAASAGGYVGSGSSAWRMPSPRIPGSPREAPSTVHTRSSPLRSTRARGQPALAARERERRPDVRADLQARRGPARACPRPAPGAARPRRGARARGRAAGRRGA